MLELDRRQALAALLGQGGLALRALATGLPMSFLARPLAAADPEADGQAVTPQALVVASSGSGDPLGNNAPGTYDIPAIIHPGAAETTAKTFSMGGNSVTGAAAWSTLPQAMLDRLAFIHHSTYTSVHTDYSHVLTMMGQVADHDQLLSQCSLALAPGLKAKQAAPLALGDGSQTSRGAALPQLPPSSLKLIFGANSSPLLALGALRTQTLNDLHAILKQGGNKLQLAFMDNFAQSRSEATDLGSSLAGDLASITDNSLDAQMRAAVALLRMNICPAIQVSVDCGGDNHSDPNLANESASLLRMVSALTTFFTQLQTYSMTDKVTFAALNVFGRTFTSLGTAGRDHWGHHCCGLLMGSRVRGGVYGGVMADGREFRATGIDAATGAAAGTGGDIPYADLLTSVGKTIAVAAGIERSVVDKFILQGQPISGALTGA